MTSCTFWLDGRDCGAPAARLYVCGRRCAAHTPAAVAGRPDHVPAPELTMEGLMGAAGRSFSYLPNESALLDQRAVASGRRRSSPEAFRDAQRAEDARRAKDPRW